jgi:hypothetical protein
MRAAAGAAFAAGSIAQICKRADIVCFVPLGARVAEIA